MRELALQLHEASILEVCFDFQEVGMLLRACCGNAAGTGFEHAFVHNPCDDKQINGQPTTSKMATPFLASASRTVNFLVLE